VVIVLTDKEEQLVQAVRSLPPDVAEQMMTWAARLADLANGQPVDWSESWSDEDLADATATSLRNFEERETQSS
jgi:hypothetical protein